MAIGRGGGSIKTKLAFLLYGDKGTWKSSMCLEFMKYKRDDGSPFRVLYIDAEQGSVDTYLSAYQENGYDLRNIYIVYTQSLSETKEFIKKAKLNQDFYEFDEETGEETDTVYMDSEGKPFRPDAIVVDGVSLLYVAKQQSMLQFSKKRATVRAKKNELIGLEKEVAIEGAGIEVKDYQGLKFSGQDLILDLLACGKHFAITAREEEEKTDAKDSSNEYKRVSTGKKIPQGFKDLGYNVKTVIHLFKDDDGVIKGHIEDKDRSLVHKQGDILEEPTLLDWAVVLEQNKNRKDFVVDNNLDKAVEIERKAIEKENDKYEQELEPEVAAEKEYSTPEEFHNAIKSAISKLDAVTKAKKQSAIVESGLPKSYTKVQDISQLKKYLEIILK